MAGSIGYRTQRLRRYGRGYWFCCCRTRGLKEVMKRWEHGGGYGCCCNLIGGYCCRCSLGPWLIHYLAFPLRFLSRRLWIMYCPGEIQARSEEHTTELQSLMRNSY